MHVLRRSSYLLWLVYVAVLEALQALREIRELVTAISALCTTVGTSSTRTNCSWLRGSLSQRAIRGVRGLEETSIFASALLV